MSEVPLPFTGSVIVTGASSFIGCHLVQRFAASGCQVLATHTQPLERYGGIGKQRLDAVAKIATPTQLDLCDGAQLARTLDMHSPDLWVHHAGYAQDYGALTYDFGKGLDINVKPLTTLFAHLADSKTRVIITGSSAEYSDGDDADQEVDPCWPSMPYGVCKLTETLAAKQLSVQHNVPTRVARVYIPYGRLDAPNKLLAHVIFSLKAGDRVALSPCLQKRDFIGITDLTAGYHALARDLDRGGFDIFNICSGVATPLRDLVCGIAKAMEADIGLLDFGALEMRPGEPDISYGDNAKARRALSWSPSSLETAIARDLFEPT